MREKYTGFYLWVVFFGYFCLGSSGNEGDKSRQTFVIRYKDGEQTIPVTVVLDYKKQTEYVINMNPRTPAKSVTFYDFKQRTIAYKDLTNRECFLGRLTHETLNEEINALQDVKNPVEVKPKIRSLDPKRPALTPTEIRNIAGQKTAVFCRKMNTWLLMSERDHGIKKREVEEYEERTHQYHGHRSTQYSHFERHTTRRRNRNKSLTNSKHRSQDNKSVAEDQNERTEVPEINLSPNFHQINSPRSNSLSTSDSNLVSTDKSQNPPNSFINHYSSPKSNFGHSKETVYRESPPASSLHPSGRISNANNYGSYNPGSRYLPSNEYASYSNPSLGDSDYFNSNQTRDTTFLDYKEPFESIRNTSKHTEQIKRTAEITENVRPSTAKTIEEDVPFLHQNDTKYPNVHPSLIHLLPLYKPLGQEFDLSRSGSESSGASFHPSNHNGHQSNIESELHPIPSANKEQVNKFTHLTKDENISQNPDVSINVLEVPKISKRFENINDSVDQSQNISKFLHSRENPPSGQQSYFRNTQHFEKNHTHNFSEYTPIKQSTDVSNIVEDAYANENNFYVPRLHTSITTSQSVLTTPQYFVTERTTPDSLYIPSVHTAFQNSEEFNSFQIFPDFIQTKTSSSSERNLTTSPFQASKNNIFDEISGGITDDTFLPTEYPSAKRRYGTSINDRSDIPSRDNNYRSVSTNYHTDKAKNTYPSFVNNATNEVVPPYRRYQNALRDFKPDEIVIDVENIPNHTLPPATSSFQQRILTTIQPTVRSSNGIHSNRNRHNELESRIARPTTRYPRRRINHKTRRPLQNGSISYPHKVQNNHHGIHTRFQANQRIAMNQYNPTYHTNRRQFHYPNQYNIPSQVRMPTEHNQLPQFSNINNLPPGVSVHPRHPQAPFADMIHSNRPPTIPIINDHQSPLKPHRQRHNRVKERHQNSCCRLRGTGAFQSCCRNGGPCCSKSQRRTQLQGSSCCSSQNTFGQVVPVNHIQPPVRIRNQNLSPTKNEELPKIDQGLKDRCQKEKMCRTLYESTQQVMVCRNADVDGC